MKTQSLFFRSASAWLDTWVAGVTQQVVRHFNNLRFHNKAWNIWSYTVCTCRCEDIWIREFVKVWGVVNASDIYGNGSRPLPGNISKVTKQKSKFAFENRISKLPEWLTVLSTNRRITLLEGFVSQWSQGPCWPLVGSPKANDEERFNWPLLIKDDQGTSVPCPG